MSAPKLPHERPTRERIALAFDGRDYPLVLESAGWRLRSRASSHPADFRTGATNLHEAKRRARAHLEQLNEAVVLSRRGGGTLEALAAAYAAAPKRTKAKVGLNNISRLRVICRAVFGRELEAVTCREVSPQMWQDYQRIALQRAGREFNLITRYRENIAINAAVRAARCLFLPALLRTYKTSGLDVRPDAGQAVMLPIPYVAPSAVSDGPLLEDWEKMAPVDLRMWLTVGLARFAGLRRDEIAQCRGGWIEVHGGAVHIALRDRPEESWWTKTGKPYRAQVIHPGLAEWLLAFRDAEPPDRLLVSDPGTVERGRWFERVPQAWLRARGISGGKPLHRLRGLYADQIAALTADAVTARLAAVRAAQSNLGHTTSAVTETHYLTPDATRRHR